LFQVGPLSEYTITFLQHLKEFFGVMFKLEVQRSDEEDSDDEDSPSASKVKMTCVGIGYVNISKRTL
jgi:RNA 3'-terminal phosphate cyclase-like protein